MWSHLAVVAVVALWQIPSAVVNAQLFPDSACSICSTTLPEVGMPNVVLVAGFAGVLLVDQTCGETEDLAQSGAYIRESCVLLRTSGVSDLCGCQEAGAPVPAPVPVPVRAPVPAPVPVPVPVPVAAPMDTPIDPPVPVPTDAAPVAVVVPTDSPVAVVVPTDSPVAVVAPTKSPVAAPVPARSGLIAPVAPVPVAGAPAAAPAAAKDDDDGLSNGAIIGIVIGSLVVITIIGGITYLAMDSNTVSAGK